MEKWFSENLRADKDLTSSALVHIERFAGETFIIPLASMGSPKHFFSQR